MEEIKFNSLRNVFVLPDSPEEVRTAVRNNQHVQVIDSRQPYEIAVAVWDIDKVPDFTGFYEWLPERVKSKLHESPLIIAINQNNPKDSKARKAKIGTAQPYLNKPLSIEIVNQPISANNGISCFKLRLGSVIEKIDAAEREKSKSNQAAGNRVGKNPVTRSSSLSSEVKSHTKGSFFGYAFSRPEQASIYHSRQERNNYLEKNLRLSSDDSKVYRMKKLILLFAHYKSIRHVNSTLSKKLETKLARELYGDDEYKHYINNCANNRATIRGKKYDRIAIMLEGRLREYFEREVGGEKAANVFTPMLNGIRSVLDYVDNLGTGFFSYKSEVGKKEMNGAMRFADALYDLLYGQPSLTQYQIDEFPGLYDLPAGRIKGLQKLVTNQETSPLLAN